MCHNYSASDDPILKLCRFARVCLCVQLCWSCGSALRRTRRRWQSFGQHGDSSRTEDMLSSAIAGDLPVLNVDVEQLPGCQPVIYFGPLTRIASLRDALHDEVAETTRH